MKSKWITHPLQSDWQIVNVFSRQLEQKEININPEDQNHKLTGCQLPENTIGMFIRQYAGCCYLVNCGTLHHLPLAHDS